MPRIGPLCETPQTGKGIAKQSRQNPGKIVNNEHGMLPYDKSPFPESIL